MRYSVDYCGSDAPENDDAWWGTEHPTWESAMLAFLRPVPDVSYCRTYSVAHIFLTLGGDVVADRPNPAFDAERLRREQDREDRLWRREIAMEAGMCLGIDAYNDAMGY